MPVTALIYLLCYLDRSNIGNARILNSTTNDSMMETNNMTVYQFTIALMAFLVAYSVFEAPSNLAMKVLHPHRYGIMAQPRCSHRHVLKRTTIDGSASWSSPSERSVPESAVQPTSRA